MLQSIDPYRPTAAVSGKVEVFGSTMMDALAHGWSQGFAHFHSKAKVEISGTGDAEAMNRLVATPSAIAMFARPVKLEELEALKRQGLKQPVAIVVAREALSVFVHASNPVTSISGEELRAVFTSQGKQDELTWAMLGAPAPWASKPIRVVSRSENSGTQKFLSDFVFDGAELRPGISAHASNAEVLQAMEADPLTIAICGYRSSNKAIKPLQLTTGASVVPSDDHAILSGQYPLTRPLTLVIDVGQSSENAKASQEFVRSALCQAGQTQAILVGFFPVDLPLLRAGQEQLGASAATRR
ncbi:MAG: substrate-binding domain-containing protein [Planctomycetales bacterium]|nr:substrate-binding domain-containing protein [Planctomycetales bacterium]